MARWKLMQPHYLNVEQIDEFEPIEWEYKEQDRETGRMRRKTFPVPMYIPAESFVSNGANSFGDIVFKGDPTPDMLPIDDEAKEISGRFESHWAHAIESLPAQGDFSASLIRDFEKQIDQVLQKKGGSVPNSPAPSIGSEQFAALQKQVEMLTAALAAKEAPVEDATPKAAPVANTVARRR